MRESWARALIARHGPTGETLGLVGGAPKSRVVAAIRAGRRPDRVDVAQAIRWYREGFEVEPADYYPGINAVALLRLRGQHWSGPEGDLDAARELLPVVRFAASRGRLHETNIWAALTIAECGLHARLLDDGSSPGGASPEEAYANAAAIAGDKERLSAVRQLELMRDADDPRDVLDPLIALLR